MSPRTPATRPDRAFDDDPEWYKDAVIYELHVRAFYDSNADGIGDFPGLTTKLDYLKDLGVTAVWLLPFYPSPLKDDGYDIADYTDVHPSYGSLRDVRMFVREAHRRGIRVITELVANHTSDQHPWFQKARQARAGSAARDFYVWSDTTDRYRDARIIFKDFESSNWSWDPVARAHYWHRFYSHQPDLNYANPQVQQAILKVLDFWLEMGIDGLRLDAVPYLFEREGTNCENLPETHAVLKRLREHVDERYQGRMLLAEANQWPEDAVTYFGEDDECHMCFHFPLMPRLFMSLRMEDRFPLVDILAQTPPAPARAQWALFLRNHDELTLEMVTDEERDYMYRAYTQDPEARINLGIRRRLAPLLGNLRRRIELMNGLLFSLPGTPVIYYGDEIGMGDNIYLGDRNGVRTPMQWSADRNAGFSHANRQRLYLPVIVDPEYHHEAINVEAQQQNPHSLLWWMKRLIALRKQHPAFGRGTLDFLHPANRKVLAFIRRHGEERILVVANLSRFVQAAELDLGEFNGSVPVELFGRTEFPPVGELPYFVTLGPHAFYWFALEPQRAPAVATADVPTLRYRGAWSALARGEAPALAEVLPGYLRARRWFGGKARRVKAARIRDAVRIPHPEAESYVAFVEVSYTEGEAETYVLPLTCAAPDRVDALAATAPLALIARLPDGSALLDATADATFLHALLDGVARRRRYRGSAGVLAAVPTAALRALRGGPDAPLEPSIGHAEQSNSSVIYGERLILKVFRRAQEGLNPELEIGRFLTEQGRFRQIAPVAGSLEYRGTKGGPVTVGILLGYVPNQGDAWTHTLRALDDYFARRASAASVEEAVGPYLEEAALLGTRTAELHLALADARGDAAFAPEPFTQMHQRSVYQSMRSMAANTAHLLKARLPTLTAGDRAAADALLAGERAVEERFRAILSRPLRSMRIRVHGDYHLGQVLCTGSDFVIIDFEGEPARSLEERRTKRSALRDVAGMLRSFDYAARTAALERDGADAAHDAGEWRRLVSEAFLSAYRATAAAAPLAPASDEELGVHLTALLLEKALYELGYELNNRPERVGIPLAGILEILDGKPRA